uniref:Uncharacterized protein n=1 Tax=Oryza nivara TaxID=4536 RepID=A0A0E0INU7_ORYNI
MAMYGGVPIGHPVAGHMVLAAVGTPVMFPPATWRPRPRCTNDETTLAPPWMSPAHRPFQPGAIWAF